MAQVKRLIGRKWNEKELQEELPFLPFKVKEISDGKIGIEVNYNNETVTFTPEEITAMVLVQLRAISEDYLKTKVKDVVISVPGFFTSTQVSPTIYTFSFKRMILTLAFLTHREELFLMPLKLLGLTACVY